MKKSGRGAQNGAKWWREWRCRGSRACDVGIDGYHEATECLPYARNASRLIGPVHERMRAMLNRIRFELDCPVLSCRQRGMRWRRDTDLKLLKLIGGLSGILSKVAQFVYRRRQRFVVDYYICQAEIQRIEKEILKALKEG